METGREEGRDKRGKMSSSGKGLNENSETRETTKTTVNIWDSGPLAGHMPTTFPNTKESDSIQM